ncbi:MAG: hypothetical protein PHQ75_12215, partial [Thermoguttaceae bacterium]|nr:hypothetical protein [Thermoguttaceae bacterium]
QKNWEAKIAAHKKKLADVRAEVAVLEREIFGDAKSKETTWDKLSLVAQRQYLRSLLNTTIFVSCEPKTFSPNTDGKIETSFILPPQYSEKGLFRSGLVYVFDSGLPKSVAKAAPATDPAAPAPAPAPAPASSTKTASAGSSARFLGVFQINQINTNRQIVVGSVVAMTEDERRQIDRSIKSGNSWIVYPDRPPIDSPDDIASWLSKLPEVLSLLSEADSKYFEKQSFSPADFVALATGAEVRDPEDKRLPVDFSCLLERNYTSRDDYNTLIARKQTALSDINIVVADQLVSLGTELTEEVKPVVDMNVYENARRANKVKTFSQQKSDLTVALADMVKQRDLVDQRLKLTQTTLAKMTEKIDSLIKHNSELAMNIAKVQFEAVKKILNGNARSVPSSGSETKANNNGATLLFRRPTFDI